MKVIHTRRHRHRHTETHRHRHRHKERHTDTHTWYSSAGGEAAAEALSRELL